MTEITDFDEERYRTEDNIEIHRYLKPRDNNVILTTITASVQIGDRTVSFFTLKNKQEMTEEEALRIANDYAKENGLNLILKKYN